MNTTLEILTALADKNRLRIVAALHDHEALCARQLAEFLNVSGATVSHHVARLVQAGLLESRNVGRRIHYRLATGTRLSQATEPLLNWIQTRLAPTPERHADRQILARIVTPVPTSPSSLAVSPSRTQRDPGPEPAGSIPIRQPVLFLCTGNSIRSQMAEALLRHLGGDRYEPLSAGMDPKAAVHPLAARVMAEIGIDIHAQKPKPVTTYLGKTFIAHLIVVCDQAQQTCPRIWPNLNDEYRYYWPFEDPGETQGSEEEKLAAFRRVRDAIRSKLEAWLHARG